MASDHSRSKCRVRFHFSGIRGYVKRVRQCATKQSQQFERKETCQCATKQTQISFPFFRQSRI